MPTTTTEQEEKVTMPDVLEIEKIKLDADVKKAKERQEAIIRGLNDRKKAPAGLKVGMTASDPLVEIFRRLRPMCLQPWERENRPQTSEEREKARGTYRWGATEQGYADMPEKHKSNISKGWIPVQETDGSHAMFGAMLCYYRDVAISRAEVSASGRMSSTLIASMDEKMKAAARDGGGEIRDSTSTVERNARLGATE